MATGEYTKALAKISKIRKNHTLKPTFSTAEGAQNSADMMVTHLESIYSGDLLGIVQAHEVISLTLPSDEEYPFVIDLIQDAINHLPAKKALGVDHLRIAMIKPIQHLLAPALLILFQIKILERCIQPTLTSEGPPLDIAQGGFRESRSALDQDLCLSEICQILRSQFCITPVLTFLDIKSAYDTVSRSFVWETLSQYISSPLLGLLRNLFDDVQIEVLPSNATSRRFCPKTGVLQGSILSPYLYSVYINQLPAQLRPQALPSSSSPLEMMPSLNCLLYADDVVLIAERSNMVDLQECIV
ncbi:hypothetical protein RMATCC62417_05127 [Rhizopus microsporus]|nr:hypothetical protein RMATCC62417_05127 [Rhizopus microsporus]